MAMRRITRPTEGGKGETNELQGNHFTTECGVCGGGHCGVAVAYTDQPAQAESMGQASGLDRKEGQRRDGEEAGGCGTTGP